MTKAGVVIEKDKNWQPQNIKERINQLKAKGEDR